MPKHKLKRLSVNFNVRSTSRVRWTENVQLICPTSVPSSTLFTPFEPIDFLTLNSVNPLNTYSSAHRRQLMDDNWCRVLEDMVTVGLGSEYPSSFTCSVCGAEIQFPIRCLDCDSLFTCCESCETSVHERKLHKPEIWKGTVFVPHCPSGAKVWSRQHHTCGTGKSFRQMEIIDIKGRDHQVCIEFCQCEEDPSQLIRFGFWPSSPVRPTTAFSIELLRLLNMLTLECSVSVAGMVQTLRWMNDLTSKQASHLYWLLIGESISQFRTYDHRVSSAGLNNKDGMAEVYQKKCPVCPKTNGIATISMDANFGLVHKHHSGTSTLPPAVTNSYFINTDEVHSFVNDYKNGQEKDKDCSNFLAGDAVRSRGRNAKLDVRGVFGSICRHEYPIMFMDMKHGEKLAYPVLMLRKLGADLSPTTEFQAVYDIACILTRHLKRTGQTDLLDEVKLALPVFHAYGHNAPCQLEYSARNLKGFGLTDGEGTERLWAYLRPLAKITKEMTSSRRLDLLSYALCHFARRKTVCLAQWFEMRILKADRVLKDAQEKLVLLKIEYKVTQDEVSKWTESYITEIRTKSARSDKNDTEKLLYQLHQCAAERSYLVSLLSKYCDGQTVAQRLSGQVRRASSQLRKYVEDYNSKPVPSSFPSTITFEDALDTANQVYLGLFPSVQDSNSVPAAVKWNAINLLNLTERAAEEQIRMGDDLKSAVSNFVDLHLCMQASSAAATTPSQQAHINKQLLKLEGVMTELWIVAENHIENFDIVQPKLFISLLCASDSFIGAVDDIDLNDIVYEENAFFDTQGDDDE